MSGAINLIKKTGYLLAGLSGRLQSSARCPSCQSEIATTVDRKFFHSLKECERCRLLFRHPAESASGMNAFYQEGYAEPGMTTELPDAATLKHLIDTRFKGSAKDFSYHLKVLQSLGLKPGSRLLDYGANWGYMTWQFQQAGVDVTAFEISGPRAAFGRELGVTIHTSLDDVGSGFDMVYSCHVLEHVPDPAETLKQQLSLVRPGGLVVAHTPNGSGSHRQLHPDVFHHTWGRVHPVLLTDRFVAHAAGDHPFLITSDDAPEAVRTWDQQSQDLRDTSGSGFFFAIRR
jgi:2-polyprenyl-3-methyl-5-hydroxy-6-metoxy-1,4-benzoquinol methylase